MFGVWCPAKIGGKSIEEVSLPLSEEDSKAAWDLCESF